MCPGSRLLNMSCLRQVSNKLIFLKIKPSKISKRCPEYISFMFEVLSCSYQKTYFQKLILFRISVFELSQFEVCSLVAIWVKLCHNLIFLKFGHNFFFLVVSQLEFEFFYHLSLVLPKFSLLVFYCQNCHQVLSLMWILLADPGECSINSLVTDPFIQWVSEPFPPTALRRRHAQTVRDRCSSYKIDSVIVIQNVLNPEGHQNPISGSKVTAILLKGWILPIGGASAGEGLPCGLRSRLGNVTLVPQ